MTAEFIVFVLNQPGALQPTLSFLLVHISMTNLSATRV